MSPWVLGSGLLAGLGCWLAASELWPAGPNLRAALDRLNGSDPAGGPDPGTGLAVRLGLRLESAAPWLPVPAADLRLLDQNTSDWLATKVAVGAAGLAVMPVATGLMALMGTPVTWTLPVGASLAVGAVLFFVPDLVTRVTATSRRTDFRYALTSYLDLVALERRAGPAPPMRLRQPPKLARAGRSPASQPRLSRLGGRAGRRGTGWPDWPQTPGSTNSPTSLTSRPSRARKAPGSWTPSAPGPSPCGLRRSRRPEPGPVRGAPRWCSRSHCWPADSWCC